MRGLRIREWLSGHPAINAAVACLLVLVVSPACDRRSGGEGTDRSGGSSRRDDRDEPLEQPVADMSPTPLGEPVTPPVRDLMPPTKGRPQRPEGPAFLGLRDSALLGTLRERKAIGARGTAGSSLSMFLNLEGEIDASFKPHTYRGQRWSGEVAAYRLGRLLGIERVPPATTRTFKVPVLEALLRDEPDILERFKSESVTYDDNTVKGAVVYWVPVIHRAEVDRLESLPRWTRWLKQGGSIPPERLGFAQQLSDTIVFDYVTGNWDRWSIHNVLYGPRRKTLLIMDNNGAFGVKFSDSVWKRLETPLLQVERYSASLYRRLVGLREEDFREELTLDPSGDSLLTDRQFELVFSRRDAVVKRIETLAREHGHDAVLCFP